MSIIGLRGGLGAISDMDAGYVFTPDGRFDVVGGQPELARPFIGCELDGVPVTSDHCDGLRTPGLLAEVFASLPGAP